jgi:hypothetical protein
MEDQMIQIGIFVSFTYLFIAGAQLQIWCFVQIWSK